MGSEQVAPRTMTHLLVAKLTLAYSQLELVQHISQNVYPQAVTHLLKILHYEKQLDSTENQTQIWLDYANFEMAENKQRAEFLYKVALMQPDADLSIWLAYINFTVTK